MDFSTKSPLNGEYHEDDVETPDLDAEDRLDWPRHPRSDFKNDPFTRPSSTRRIFSAVAIFFLMALVGVGAAFAWRSYSGQLTDMVKAQASQEVQQQLKPIVTDLAAMKRTIEQFTTKQDQLTRTQEQMAQTIAKLSLEQQLSQNPPSPPPLKPVAVPPSKPLQPPAQASSKPVHILPPQSLQPPGH